MYRTHFNHYLRLKIFIEKRKFILVDIRISLYKIDGLKGLLS